MTDIVKIDDEVINADGFIKLLKMNGRFESLIEDILKDKLTVHAAKRKGVAVTDEEVQERADQFRRAHGLHRAKDTNEYFDALGVTLEEFETFIVEMLHQEKMMVDVGTDTAIGDYFQSNSPKFDSIEISHIVLDSEGKAKEMMSILMDDPESFSEMAREHSLADTREQGGVIGKLLRGSMQAEIEAKVFNAAEGDLLGPFPTSGGSYFEIFLVNTKHPAQLDGQTTSQIRRLLKEQWLAARAREHRIEAL